MAKFSNWMAWASQGLFVVGGVAVATAADPTAKEALELLKPVQIDVQYERPTKELDKCSIHKLNEDAATGWIVRDGTGQMLRRFADTNKDGKLDLWCYYRDGVEVYRDVDSNFNGKADQYRWLGIGGIRWGVDENEDGRIDRWKLISYEEVTAEVVAALRDKDTARFSRLLITRDELKSLGLDAARAQEIEKKLTSATDGFKAVAEKQRLVSAKTEWVNSAAVQPGLFPAGTDGTTKDVIVYENVAAMVDNGGKTAQVAIGTLVQVGGVWRLIDLPPVDNQTAANQHFFLPIPGKNELANSNQPTLTPEMQELVTKLENLDTALIKASLDEKAKLHGDKVAVLERLRDVATTKEDRDNHTRALADSLGAAIQGGEFPEGLDRLHALMARLEGENSDQTAFVTFRYLTAKYGLDVQDSKADVAKIQSQWTESLEHFVKRYPNASDAPEAMMQLAIAQEFAGKADEAVSWFEKIARNFPDAPEAKKAAGAKFRLESVGKNFSLKGRGLDGKTVDLAAYQGGVVLVHYWATWCEPFKSHDLALLKQALAKYSPQGFRIVGVSLDSDAKLVPPFVQSNKINWPQIYEAGGLDSRPANEMGIFTLPTMLLVDRSGRVLLRDVHAADLDKELERLFKVTANTSTPRPTTGATQANPTPNPSGNRPAFGTKGSPAPTRPQTPPTNANSGLGKKR